MRPLVRVRQPAGYAPEREYAVRVVLEEFLGLDVALETESRGDVELAVPDDSGRRVLLADGLFRTPPERWLTADSLPAVRRWDASESPARDALVSPSLPVLFGEPEVEAGDGLIRVGLDVFGSAFFLLTRYEELCLPERDEHGRFPLTASICGRAGIVDRPLVNEYVELLWWALSSLWPRLERRPRTFRVVPSHDVDWPLNPDSRLAAVAADLVKRRDPALALGRLVRRERLNDVFDLIMDESERLGLRSAFYFIAGPTGRSVDGSCDLDHPFVRALLRRVDGRGHEIGLHPSYETFRDPELTRQELDRLRAACEREGVAQQVSGGRQHFLRWENPVTWRNWEEAGLEYDSTLSFREEPGFRCGVCYEYPVFDLRARRQLRLRERPLVVMEVSALGDDPRRDAEGLERIRTLRDRCRRYRGDFTLLWHNNWLVSRRQQQLYRAALGADG